MRFAALHKVCVLMKAHTSYVCHAFVRNCFKYTTLLDPETSIPIQKLPCYDENLKSEAPGGSKKCVYMVEVF